MCPTAVITCAVVNATTNCRSAFDILDVDRDGKISQQDLQKFYPDFRLLNNRAPLWDEEHEAVEAMICVADENKNGFVEFEEFEKVIECKQRIGIMRMVMEEVFRVMDRDGDGKVGKEDLRRYMEWAGFKVRDEDIMAMIRLGSGVDDDNGKEIGVTFDEFLKILAL